MRSERQLVPWVVLASMLCFATAHADGPNIEVVNGAVCGEKEAEFRSAVLKHAKDPAPLWRLVSALLCDSGDWDTRKKVVRASAAAKVRRTELVEYEGDPELVRPDDDLISEITWREDTPDAYLIFPSPVRVQIVSGDEDAVCAGAVQADYRKGRWVITQYDLYCD